MIQYSPFLVRTWSAFFRTVHSSFPNALTSLRSFAQQWRSSTSSLSRMIRHQSWRYFEKGGTVCCCGPRSRETLLNMAEVTADGRTAAQLSEAAQSELLDMCEEQFGQLEKLQNEIVLCEPDFCENPQEQSVKRLIATEAERNQWLTVEPQLLAENSEILLEAGKEQMHKLCSELEMVASCYEAKRDKLKETKELELKWLEEKKQVLAAATGHAERLQIEKEKLSEHTVLQDIKEKIQKMKVYQEGLMECLGYILEKHVPLPQDDSGASKKKNVAHEIHENLISLNEILEILMNKALNTPHDPYVAIDDTFWPPYVEMLLRYGIAVRHQENNLKIRLETFF